MSGSTLLHVSQLVPRSLASGAVVLGYDPVADTFVTLQPSALQGQIGPTGATGATGAQGPQGVPGSAGTNGTAVRSSTGAPPASLGANGDFCIDTQNKIMYGPKANGAWPSPGFSLVGPAGAQGPTGPTGPAGTGGTGSAANIDNGTIDGQIAVWVATAGKWQPQTGVSITADRNPTVEINTAGALTFAAHNRRNIVLSALAAQTLAASEAGTGGNIGMEFLIQNDHTAVNQITFGTGLTVRQPSTGTGTGGVVKIAVDGEVAVCIYPKGGAVIAKIRGDVA